jgi:hypothetical protein
LTPVTSTTLLGADPPRNNANYRSTIWAAANGITQIATANDETNAAMLAINKRLGFRAAGRRVEVSAERERLLRERREHL